MKTLLYAAVAAFACSTASGATTYKLQVLNVFGSRSVTPLGIDAKGNMSGMYFPNGAQYAHAFLYKGGAMIDVADENPQTSYAGRRVNKSAQMLVASWNMLAGTSKMFWYQDGKRHKIPGLGDLDDVLNGINDGGVIIGTSSGQSPAAAWKFVDGVTSRLLPDAAWSQASDINNAGQIVGSFVPANSDRRGFVTDGVTTTVLGTLGGNISEAVTINDAGHVVGTATTLDPGSGPPTSYNAFIYRKGKMKSLGSLGGGSSTAIAINGKDQVIGTSLLSDLQTLHPFLWTDGSMVDLKTLIDPATAGDWTLDSLVGISDKGVILVKGHSPMDGTRALLLVPNPD
ncbi:MAG TPA: hypothetical protein VLA61_18690 [Ideonella sp.]|uniref:hypothetical protein n=1 Tax=Ideonella sp. TaxID=1929293 RepID=UPI002CD1B439|nr:hypothetical protein [Ideonella sp.]HSI50304.1 hypothetical protein [Ideonella sp.]